MEMWLNWARGPLFLFCFSFMLLGLVRHIVLTAWGITRAVQRAGDKSLPLGQIASSTLKWMLPLGKIGEQPLFTLTSILFHVAILVTPIFLAGHIALWERGLGITWPAISNRTADLLTLLAIGTTAALLAQRLSARATRALSRFQDYLLLPLLSLPFVTGYVMMHPTMNPISYDLVFLIHLLSANLIFLLIPLTKLAHLALFPGTQLVSELAWHWPPNAGSRLAKSLGKENAPV
jgi:nitrate reductase gamma subunit